MCVCVCVCMYVCLCVRVWVYYTHTHAHTHTDRHTQPEQGRAQTRRRQWQGEFFCALQTQDGGEEDGARKERSVNVTACVGLGLNHFRSRPSIEENSV